MFEQPTEYDSVNVPDNVPDNVADKTKLKRKIVIVVCVILLLFLSVVTAFALKILTRGNEDDTVSNKANVSLTTISQNTANANGVIVKDEIPTTKKSTEQSKNKEKNSQSSKTTSHKTEKATKAKQTTKKKSKKTSTTKKKTKKKATTTKKKSSKKKSSKKKTATTKAAKSKVGRVSGVGVSKSGGNIRATWSSASNAVSYIVELNGPDGYSSKTTSLTSTQFKVSTPGTYKVKVTPVGSDGNHGSSSSGSYTLE